MPLNIHARWSRPIPLVRAQRGSGAIYHCEDIDDIPGQAGVYIFGRQHGQATKPFYVGKATNLNLRIWQQLNSVALMSRIRDAEAGSRFLIYAVPTIRPGQNAETVIKVMEDALIAHLLGQDYELFQTQGTKRPNHTIQFNGNRTSESLAPRLMRVRA